MGRKAAGGAGEVGEDKESIKAVHGSWTLFLGQYEATHCS